MYTTHSTQEKKTDTDIALKIVIKSHPLKSEQTSKIIHGRADVWYEIFCLGCFFSCDTFTLTHAIAVTPELVARVYQLNHSLSITPSNIQE